MTKWNHRAVAFVIMLAVAVSVALLAQCSSSDAHDFWINNSHYKSPIDGTHCCGEGDCFELSESDVIATPLGWLIKSLNETVPYSEAQTSEDGAFWRCKHHDGSRRCFFAGARGY